MQIIDLIIKAIKSVPDVIWSGAIASLITLSGVWVSNRNSRKLQLTRLKHEADQRNLEREMSLRKEIYLEAMESISNSIVRIGRLNEIDLTTQNNIFSEGVVQETSSFYKISIIGSNETLQAVSALTFGIYTYLAEMALKRARINMLDKKIEILGNTEEKAFERLDLLLKKLKENIEFINSSVDASIKINELSLPAIFAIRRELKLPIDEEAYKKLSQEYQEKMKELVRTIMRSQLEDAKASMDALMQLKKTMEEKSTQSIPEKSD